jgi:hypothetical protein
VGNQKVPFSESTVRFHYEIRAYVDVPAKELEFHGVESLEELHSLDGYDLEEIVMNADGFSDSALGSQVEVDGFQIIHNMKQVSE